MITQLGQLHSSDSTEGVITWRRGESESVIDFILVNNKMLKYFKSMHIDEDREQYDLSDHSLLSAVFSIKCEKTHQKSSKKKIQYYKINDRNKEKFISAVENQCRNKEPSNIDELEKIITDCANDILKMTKFVDCAPNKEKNHLWITEEIKRNIKLRKRLCRTLRNCSAEEKDSAKANYIEQKNKTRILIQEATSKHERKLTREIKEDKGRKLLWNQINKLRGKENVRKKFKIYNEDGSAIEEGGELNMKTIEYWSEIYRMHYNDSAHVWNNQTMEKYKEQLEKVYENDTMDLEGSENSIPSALREHFDAVVRINLTNSRQSIMEEPLIQSKEIEEHLRNMKSKKAPGPNGIKNDLIKCLSNCEIFRKLLWLYYNDILDGGEIPESWKKSCTKMIPKKSKPCIKDLRPIALINST